MSISKEIAKLSKEINTCLKKHKKTLCTAESCTSGQVAMSITSIPGSSVFFKGGMVCYCNEMKIKFLNVSPTIIECKGVVSKEVVIAMMFGAINTMNTDYAIAITGYAGPDSGNEVPAGTIWIAVGNKQEYRIVKQESNEGREKNLQRATKTALETLVNLLKNQETTNIE